MNTPAHAALNLLLLTRSNPDHRKTAAIVAGALIPDLAIIVFYAWHSLRGTPEELIWSIEYFRPLWQGLIDGFNSIPLIGLAMLLCWQQQKPLLLLIAGSMLLHSLGDLPLHHDDAHRHFFPLYDWRFVSPVSYWDPAHHGAIASLVEILAVAAASIFLYCRHTLLKPWVASIVAVYLCYWVYVWLVWM